MTTKTIFSPIGWPPTSLQRPPGHWSVEAMDASCTLDVSLTDPELLAEVELMTNLIIVANGCDRRLTQPEIDAALGLLPEDDRTAALTAPRRTQAPGWSSAASRGVSSGHSL